MSAPATGLLTCPEELLADIFSYGAAGPNDYQDAEIMRPNKDRISASFYVASVCQRWRSIAVSYACLWHYIAFPMHSVVDDEATQSSSLSLERNTLYARLMLERSGDAPIDIIFRFIDGDTNQDVTLEPLLRMLTEHRSRWRRFAVALCGSQVAAQVLDLFTGVALPTLRTLQISMQDTRYERTYEISPREAPENKLFAGPFLEHTPRLVNVAAINLPELWTRWKPVQAQHRVAVLEILQQELPNELWDMLVTQGDLEWIMLGAGVFDAPRFPRPPAEPIDLPKMEILWIQREASKIFEAYPQLLKMPRLCEVVLDRVTFPPLAPWFQTLRPQLTALDLRNPPDLTVGDVAVIRILNKLETLQMSGRERMSTPLLECLCERGDDANEDGVPVMWPRLTAIKLFSIHFDETGATLLSELVKMRCQPAPLDAKGMPRWAKLGFRLARSSEHGLDEAQLEEIERLGSTVDLV